jgi:glycosyltransferase involved in cell wall biosynthesis
MKIVIIIPLFPPKCNDGTEIVTFNLAEQLAKRGHEIHVITSSDKGLLNIEHLNGFDIHRIPFPEIRFIGPILFWLKIVLKIHQISPKIVHAQDFCMGIPAYWAKKVLKIPYIIWGQGEDVYHPLPHQRISNKLILQNASKVVALTKNMQNKIIRLYGIQSSIIPNGFDIQDSRLVKITPEKKIGNQNVLFVGRLIPVKGIEYLIIAMKDVIAKKPATKLILIGEGIDKQNLLTLSRHVGIEKNVQFVGQVSHDEVFNYMNQADILVLPSLSEGFPMVILESMACGLPIIASRVGGIPDILTNEINGYLVEAKDSENLANKIILLLQDDSLRKEISDNNKNEVKKYSWENICIELEKIYELSIL